MNTRSLAGHAALVLYLSAALHDAKPHERKRLKEQMPAHVNRMKTARNNEEYASVLRDVFGGIHSIMPDDWEPTGEYKANIDSLLGRNKDADG